MIALGDLIRETTTTTGTGSFALLGREFNCQGFDVLGDGAILKYKAMHRSEEEWEIGIGTYTLATTTLARTTVHITSTGGNVAIDFSAGVKDIECVIDSLWLKRITAVAQNVAALAVDWSLSNRRTKSVAADSVFTFSNVNDGDTLELLITNTDASDHTMTFPAASAFESYSAVVLAGKSRLFIFTKIGATIWAGSAGEA